MHLALIVRLLVENSVVIALCYCQLVKPFNKARALKTIHYGKKKKSVLRQIYTGATWIAALSPVARMCTSPKTQKVILRNKK